LTQVLLHTSGLKVGHTLTVIVFTSRDRDDKVMEVCEGCSCERDSDDRHVGVVAVAESDDSGKDEVQYGDDDGGTADLRLEDEDKGWIRPFCAVLTSDGNNDGGSDRNIVVDLFDTELALVVDKPGTGATNEV
jgi:hypothetical protein